MTLSQKFHNSVILRSKNIVQIVSILATFGTVTVLLGGVWDTTSHAIRIPENFWTIQHITIYTGASLVAFAAFMGALVLSNTKNKKMSRGIKIILLGAAMQLVGGYADYNFHEKFGIDGLVTPSHLTVEGGLLLISVGGFIIASGFDHGPARKVIPITIMAVLLSASWIGFNLFLLIGAVVLCIPVFQLFSSGCAVM